MVSRVLSFAVYRTVQAGEKFPIPVKKLRERTARETTAQYTTGRRACIGGKCSYGGKIAEYMPEYMIFKKVLDIRKKLCYSVKALVAE